MRLFTTAVLALMLSGFAQTPWPQTLSSKPLAAATANTPPSARTEGQSKIDPAKEADIRRLLDLMQTKTVATHALEEMTTTMRPVLAASLPPGEYREKLIDLFFEKFKSKTDTQHFVDMAVPIYDKHFSQEEIKGLIQFYQTPLGHKAASEVPAISAEMGGASKEWGRVLGRDSMQEVLAEHPDMLEALTKASQANQH